ncbi:hypothetical protein F4780DRAFT_739208, partial [Xylariomycetidae sp. FL0641]
DQSRAGKAGWTPLRVPPPACTVYQAQEQTCMVPSSALLSACELSRMRILAYSNGICYIPHAGQLSQFQHPASYPSERAQHFETISLTQASNQSKFGVSPASAPHRRPPPPLYNQAPNGKFVNHSTRFHLNCLGPSLDNIAYCPAHLVEHLPRVPHRDCRSLGFPSSERLEPSRPRSRFAKCVNIFGNRICPCHGAGESWG